MNGREQLHLKDISTTLHPQSLNHYPKDRPTYFSSFRPSLVVMGYLGNSEAIFFSR